MASEQALAVRRVKAIEEQAKQLAEVNRKLDLVMLKLGIQDGAEVAQVPEVANVPEVSEAAEMPDQPKTAIEPEIVTEPEISGEAKSKKK